MSLGHSDAKERDDWSHTYLPVKGDSRGRTPICYRVVGVDDWGNIFVSIFVSLKP